MKIPIRCKGNRTLPYDKLKRFQGNLKEMSKSSFDKLRASILEHGWIAPVFVWGRDKILDGHGRLLVLDELLREGYIIAGIPVVDIDARTKKEAAKILLSINSHYQSITGEGLYEFMTEMEVDLSELENIELSDIDLKKFEAEFFTSEELNHDNSDSEIEHKYHVIADCASEEEQRAIYESLVKEGRTCRVLTL